MPSRVAHSCRLVSMLFAAACPSLGRSSTITSGIPAPAFTASAFSAHRPAKGFTVSFTLMLGSSLLHTAITLRKALWRTGDPQKCHISMVPDTSGFSFGTPASVGIDGGEDAAVGVAGAGVTLSQAGRITQANRRSATQAWSLVLDA